MCDGLNSPRNGFVSPAAKAQLFNSTAVYSCKSGWQIDGGTNPRICQEDGAWSGEAPNCTREYVVWKILDPALFSITDWCTNPKVGGTNLLFGQISPKTA